MLKGKRIWLRPFTDEDLPLIAWLGAHPLYHETAGFANISSPQMAHEVLSAYERRPENWVILHPETKKAIGFIELNERGVDERSHLDQTREIGFVLREEFWGQGYMSEALALVLDYAFTELKVSEIWAGHYENNTRSEHLLRKFGFEYKYQVEIPFAFIEQTTQKYYLLTATNWQRFRDKSR